MTAVVYIATSLDGYIADRDGSIEWLNQLPNPEGSDFGFAEFVAGIDALLMGRNTFETVLGFGGEWPYAKPVFVASTSLERVPDALAGRVQLVRGTPRELCDALALEGHARIYIDGGRMIQSFLAEDLIDELILSRVPVVLGGGVPLFGELDTALSFEHLETEVHAGALVMSRYRRRR